MANKIHAKVRGNTHSGHKYVTIPKDNDIQVGEDVVVQREEDAE